MILNFWSFCFLLQSVVITSMSHCSQFVWCWSSNPELSVHRAGLLPTEPFLTGTYSAQSLDKQWPSMTPKSSTRLAKPLGNGRAACLHMKSPQFRENGPSLTGSVCTAKASRKKELMCWLQLWKLTYDSAPSQSFFMGSSPAQGLWGDSGMDAESKHPALNEHCFVFLQAIVRFVFFF